VRSRAPSPLLPALAALVLPAFAAAARSQAPPPVYEATVRRYASGEQEGAVTEMVAWSEGRLRDEIAALKALWRKARACPDCPAASTWQRIPVAAALPELARHAAGRRGALKEAP